MHRRALKIMAHDTTSKSGARRRVMLNPTLYLVFDEKVREKPTSTVVYAP